MTRFALLAALVLAAAVPRAAAGWAVPLQSDALRNAKTLFFDREYARAREAWLALRSREPGALYWVARCSESLGEHERALREYGDFLASPAPDPVFVEEAQTSRIGLAARLYRDGEDRHLGILRRGLDDPSPTVRYYAALQLSGLGREVGRAAIPVLKDILAREDDPDLVDRARLRLLRLDPDALEDDAPATGDAAEVRWVRLEIRDAGGTGEPELSIRLPVGLAELVFKSLPEDARRELSRSGIDAANFWERLKQSGPTSILEIRGEDGEHIRLWLE